MSDDDSKSEQLGQPSALHRTADLDKLEAQIAICLEAFNKLDLRNNLDTFKESVRQQTKGSFTPPTDP